MASDNPTNGELKIMLDDIKEVVLEIKEDGKEVKVQTTKTNGRVTQLESDHRLLKESVNSKWWALSIIITVLCGFFAFIIPLSVKIIKRNQQLTIETEIPAAVNSAMTTFEASLETKYNIQVDNSN